MIYNYKTFKNCVIFTDKVVRSCTTETHIEQMKSYFFKTIIPILVKVGENRSFFSKEYRKSYLLGRDLLKVIRNKQIEIIKQS